MRIRSEPIGERYIEFAHTPPHAVEAAAAARPIQPIPFPISAATAIVIDGKPYCAFVSRSDAIEALNLWLGNVDGLGRRVTKHFGPHWPALRGRQVEVIDLNRVAP